MAVVYRYMNGARTSLGPLGIKDEDMLGEAEYSGTLCPPETYHSGIVEAAEEEPEEASLILTRAWNQSRESNRQDDRA